jgi:hypothetical protein
MNLKDGGQLRKVTVPPALRPKTWLSLLSIAPASHHE